MKKWMLVPLAVALLIPATAAAQGSTKLAATKQDDLKARKSPTKAVTISGQVSVDGKMLVSDEDDIWAVSNPNVLAGHEGKQVLVKCQVHADKNEIHVLSIKDGLVQARYVVKNGDSAFRR
jgi:hypothetical protein